MLAIAWTGRRHPKNLITQGGVGCLRALLKQGLQKSPETLWVRTECANWGGAALRPKGMDTVQITDTASYGAQKVSAIRGYSISARQDEPSGVAALWYPNSARTATGAQAPIPCVENFRVSKFVWHRRGNYRLCMRRKRSCSWRRQSPPRGLIYSRAAQTEKKSVQWAPASAEYPRLNQESRGARTPHRSSRSRRDCAYGCRFHSRSAAEIRLAPRCWVETRVRRTTGRGQIRGRSICVRSR